MKPTPIGWASHFISSFPPICLFYLASRQGIPKVFLQIDSFSKTAIPPFAIPFPVSRIPQSLQRLEFIPDTNAETGKNQFPPIHSSGEFRKQLTGLIVPEQHASFAGITMDTMIVG